MASGILTKYKKEGSGSRSRKRPSYVQLHYVVECLAEALGLTPGDHMVKSKNVPYVELRWLGAIAIMEVYPSVPLTEITVNIYRMNHTTMLHGMTRMEELLDIEDPSFMAKYNKMLEVVSDIRRMKILTKNCAPCRGVTVVRTNDSVNY